MIEIGSYQDLVIDREVDFGVYLVDEEGDDVLLPAKWVPEWATVGDSLCVFVYKDHEQRPIATTLEPKIVRGGFAFLQVKEVAEVGAFVDWGLEKDLLVPFAHQAKRMRAGHSYVIFLLFDEKSERLIGSSKLHKFVERRYIDLDEGDEVDLLVVDRTDLGYTVIIDDAYKGLIYHNEIFRKLSPGEVTKGYVKNIREDGSIDAALTRPGFTNIPESEKFILETLEKSDGFLNLTDKSDPNEIRERMEMSKKTFKAAIGGLYKKRLVRLEKDGVYLVEESGDRGQESGSLP